MEEFIYVLKELEKEWFRKIVVLVVNYYMNIFFEYFEDNWVLVNNYYSLIKNKVY